MVVVAAALAYFPRNTTAQEWPEFRGPSGQGLSRAENLPLHWSTSRNVRWVQPIPGRGWSSPVVAGGRIYLTTSVPETESEPGDQSLRLLALDERNGRVVWNREIRRVPADALERNHRKNSYASPTPILHGDRIFVHFGHLGSACLTLDGREIWQQTGLTYRPVHGTGGSPVIHDGLLLYSADGGDDPFLAALDLGTGEPRWQVPRPTEAAKTFSFSTPLVIRVEARPQLISPGSDCVLALDPTDGSTIWRVDYEGYSVVPRPVYGNGLVYLSTGFDEPRLLAIRPTGSGNVTRTHVAWRLDRGAPLTPSPLLVDKRVFLVSDRGIATCVDAVTGEQVWQDRLTGNFSASPLYADGNIYFQSEEGLGQVIRAADSFELLAENDLEETTYASYAVSGSSLLIRTASRLYRVERLPSQP